MVAQGSLSSCVFCFSLHSQFYGSCFHTALLLLAQRESEGSQRSVSHCWDLLSIFMAPCLCVHGILLASCSSSYPLVHYLNALVLGKECSHIPHYVTVHWDSSRETFINHSCSLCFQNEASESLLCVKLQILSNWGHPKYTCLYRFRVHGIPTDHT